MKKILFYLSVIIFYTLNTSYATAENINGVNYNNLDKIEIIGYYHPTLVSAGDAPGGGLGDIRFNQRTQGKSLFSYPELQPFLNNVQVFKSIHWESVIIGALNDISPLNDGGIDGYYNDGIYTTGNGEFLLISSKSFSGNVMKNPIFKDALNINDIPWSINYSELTEYFKKNKIKIIGRFYHIQGKYVIEEEHSGKIQLNLNWNIILVDDISLDLKTNTPVSKEKTKKIRWYKNRGKYAV